MFIGMPRLRHSREARESDVLAHICEKCEVGLDEAVGIFVQIRKKERKILKYDSVENEWMGFNTYKETCDLTTTNRALLSEFRKQTKVFEVILEILSREFGPPTVEQRQEQKPEPEEAESHESHFSAPDSPPKPEPPSETMEQYLARLRGEPRRAAAGGLDSENSNAIF